MNTNIGDYFQKVQPAPGGPQKNRGRTGLLARIRRVAARSSKWVSRHRIMAGGMAVFMVLTVVAPAFYGVLLQRKYVLSDATNKVIGDVADDLAKKLVYDDSKQAYIFNKENMLFDLPDANTNKESADRVAAVRLLQAKAASQDKTAKVGGQGKDDSQLYASQFPKDFARGATYYDTEAQTSFSLVPKFTAMSGDLVDGRLVYPLKEYKGQAIYTVKSDGVKEDVVLHEFAGDTVRLEYTLALPKTLQAKLLESGDIGVYSADPSVYGSSVLSANADMDMALKAQETAAKTHLTYVIPAPLVTEVDGDSSGVKSTFTLENNNVAVITTGLAKASYPLSIDPTVVVASSASLATGNNETMVDLSISGQASRASITGAVLDAAGWTSSTSFTTARNSQGTIAYNGYMYVIGGDSGSSVPITSVQYAAINSNGTLGSWSSTTALPVARSNYTAVAYNGYVYAAGGSGTSATLSDVVYAVINSNGTLGSWNTTTSLPTARYDAGSFAYNGYMYILGGYNSGSPLNEVYYAAINANGTLGSWTSTSSFTTARRAMGAVVHNGYAYVVGGDTGNGSSGATQLTNVQYAPINANGTIGSWTATTSFTTSRSSHATVLSNGYLYIMGGYNSSFSNQSDVQFAQINADGTLGAWNATTNMATSRFGMGAVAYGGYLYYLGGGNSTPTRTNATYYIRVSEAGMTGVTGNTTSSFTSTRERHAATIYNGYMYTLGGYGSGSDIYLDYVQYNPIDSSGDITAATTSGNSLTTPRADLAAAAYNGYLYNFGGYNAQTGTWFSTVEYSSLNASTGANSTWTATTSLPTARAGIEALAYNDYMYIVGGRDSGGTNLTEIRYAAINSNGTLGAWNSTTALGTGVNRMRIAQYNGYLYVLGGVTAALPTYVNGGGSGSRATAAGATTVQYAAINSNGTLGSFSSANSMPTGRYEFGAIAYKGYLYALGGFVNTTITRNIDFAKINTDGSIGAWQTGTPISNASSNAASQVGLFYNGYIYLNGGRTDTAAGSAGRTSSTDRVPINNGGTGTINTWTTSGNSMPAGRSNAASVQVNGYAYVIGGAGVNTYVYAALNRDGSVGTWSSAQSFPATLTGASAVTYRGYIYVVGGNTTNVYYAKPNSNGSVSSWTSTTALPAALQYGGAVVSAGNIYMIGGAVGSTSQTTVYVAPINADNSLGSWQTEGNALPAARHYIQPVMMNGYVYVVGGYNGTSSQTTTYYAKINSSGSLSTWTSAGNRLPAANSGAVTVAANGYIYNISGVNDSTIYGAPVSNTGWVGQWHTLNTIPASRSYGTGVYANGFLYVFGGNSSTAVYYASVNSIARIARYSKLVDLGTNTNLQAVGFSGLNTDGISLSTRAASLGYVFVSESFDATSATYAGTLNPWGSTSTISAREGGGMVTVNGYMYYLGGYISSATAQVYYAKANGDGTVGAWAATTSLPGARDSAAAAGLNGYIYVLGGYNGSAEQSTVYYAKPNADGTITSWSTTTTLPDAMSSFSAAVMNGYIYVTESDNIHYTQANANGTLQAWQSDNNVLPNQRAGAGFVAANGYLYVIGGVEGGTARNTVYISGVAANGSSLGFSASGNTLPASRYDGAAYYFGGYIYYMAGQQSGFNAQSGIYYTKVNSNGSIDPWTTSSVVVPDGGRVWPGYTISNGYLYIVAGYSGSNDNTTYYTNVKRLWGDTVNNVRYAQVTVIIDDTTANSGYGENLQGILNGIYLDYRIVSPPTHRLRGGKFFVDGALQPLIQPNTNNN